MRANEEAEYPGTVSGGAYRCEVNQMYMIVGLGNPEKKYDKTRHNIGFRLLDALADRNHIEVEEKKHKGLCWRGVIAGQKVILVKPQTYMNLSGECVREVADFYKIAPEEIIILFDDIDLEPGKLRIRKKGSAGGHNGIKSIIAQLGSQDFPRLKFGVGDRPRDIDLADHVLGRFSRDEEEIVGARVAVACDAVECMLSEGVEAAMNRYNSTGA